MPGHLPWLERGMRSSDSTIGDTKGIVPTSDGETCQGVHREQEAGGC